VKLELDKNLGTLREDVHTFVFFTAVWNVFF